LRRFHVLMEYPLSRLRLTINSDLRDVVFVGLMVNRFCEYLRMDPVASGEVEICAVEAVTNAIRHAYRNQSGNEVSITLTVRNQRLELEVVDTGLAMSPATRDRLTLGSNVLEFNPRDVETVPEGGMGLQIIHEVMDEVSYRSEGEVNSLQLIRLLNGVEQDSWRRSADDRTVVQSPGAVPDHREGAFR
jgi:serine/threonine-protein kinase RsbW